MLSTLASPALLNHLRTPQQQNHSFLCLSVSSTPLVQYLVATICNTSSTPRRIHAVYDHISRSVHDESVGSSRQTQRLTSKSQDAAMRSLVLAENHLSIETRVRVSSIICTVMSWPMHGIQCCMRTYMSHLLLAFCMRFLVQRQPMRNYTDCASH